MTGNTRNKVLEKKYVSGLLRACYHQQKVDNSQVAGFGTLQKLSWVLMNKTRLYSHYNIQYIYIYIYHADMYHLILYMIWYDSIIRLTPRHCFPHTICCREKETECQNPTWTFEHFCHARAHCVTYAWSGFKWSKEKNASASDSSRNYRPSKHKQTINTDTC